MSNIDESTTTAGPFTSAVVIMVLISSAISRKGNRSFINTEFRRSDEALQVPVILTERVATCQDCFHSDDSSAAAAVFSKVKLQNALAHCSSPRHFITDLAHDIRAQFAILLFL